MRAHLNAVKALLEVGWSHPIHLGEPPSAPTFPYVLLWASPGRMVADEVDGDQDDLNDLLGVTVVAATYEAALQAVGTVRGHLNGRRPSVPGRHVQPLRLEPGGQPLDFDRDVKIPNTNRHPAFAVERYRLISEPLED